MQPNPNWAVISTKYREKLSWDHHFPKKWSSAPPPLYSALFVLEVPNCPILYPCISLKLLQCQELPRFLFTRPTFCSSSERNKEGYYSCRMFSYESCHDSDDGEHHRRQRINAMSFRCFGPIHGLDSRCFVWPVQIALS